MEFGTHGDGKRATCKHDGTPWTVSDRARATLVAKEPDLPFRGALCEVRGDWKVYKECFNFPAWGTLEGITPPHISLRICTPRPQEEPPPQEEGHNHGSGGGGEGRREGDHTGICWRCDCTPVGIRNVGSDKSWRQNRRTTWGFLRKVEGEQHQAVSFYSMHRGSP